MYSTKNKEKIELSIYLKIALNYYQINTIIANMNIEWPYNVKKYFDSFSTIGDIMGQLFSFDCLLFEMGYYYNSIYIRTMAVVLFPIISYIYCAIHFFMKKLIVGQAKFRKVIVAVAVFHIIMQPFIVSKFLENFNYIEIENVKYLYSDTDIKWNTYEFQRWVCLQIKYVFLFF